MPLEADSKAGPSTESRTVDSGAGVSEREREEEAGDGRAVPSLGLKGPAQSGGKASGRSRP